MDSNLAQEPARPFSILPGFVPKSALWSGEGAPFPSRSAAEWALSRLRVKLKEEKAFAMYRGRTLVHPERIRAVLERDALRVND